LYEHVEQSEMEWAYIELVEEWNSSMVECEEEKECEDPQIFFVLNETFQGVGVENESRALKFLTFQEEECGHTKWSDTHMMEENDYLILSQEGRVRWDADCFIEPRQVCTVMPAYNNYKGTEWIMVNGLKETRRFGGCTGVCICESG